MDIEVGDGGDTFTKRPSMLEEIAYWDTWGKGTDSFIAMSTSGLHIYKGPIISQSIVASSATG